MGEGGGRWGMPGKGLGLEGENRWRAGTTMVKNVRGDLHVDK